MKLINSYAFSNVATALLIVFVVVFLHFVVARPFNFPATIGLFGSICIIYRLHSELINIKQLDFILTISLFSIFHVQEIISSNFDLFEYTKTYILWVFSFSVILSFSFLRQSKSNGEVERAALISLGIIMLFTVFQSITSAMGNTDFLNVFGNHQYFGTIDTSTLMQDERFRPPGFYLEPSFCAYVATSLLAICLISNKNIILSILFCFITLMAIQSLTGLVSFIVVYIVYIGVNEKIGIYSKIYGVAGLVIAIVIIYMFYGDYVLNRYEQVFTPGTSTYYRTIALLPILYDTFVITPFGHAFGTMEEVVLTYNIPHGITTGTSIDNGIYLLIFYFGFGFFVLIYFAMLAMKAVKNRRKYIALVAIIMGCFFNGGIVLPEFALITGLIIYAARNIEETDEN